MKYVLLVLLLLPTIAQASTGDIAASDILAIAVGYIIAVFVTRLIFSIPRIIRSMRAQTYLLAIMAKKQGCDPKLIEKAVWHMEGGENGNDLALLVNNQLNEKEKEPVMRRANP